MTAPLPDLLLEPIVRAALAEDLGRAGDITSAACIPAGTRMAARFATRQAGTIAGLDCVRLSIAALDPTTDYRFLAQGLRDVAEDAEERGVGFVLRRHPDNSLEAFLEEGKRPVLAV